LRRLIECVPNFSEGRSSAVVDQIAAAICGAPGAIVVDREMDADHNRSVITFVCPVDAALEAAVAAVSKAAELIDLTRHTGAHPRIGAADVLPFVPLEGVSLQECVELAWQVGEEIWRRCRIPVYYYEAAAKRPERVKLENIRRGQFEGLREEVLRNPARRPDVGGPSLHPTAGATVVGARKFLIAYNINLATADVAVAKAIARKIRESSGGLPCVKAMGVDLKARNRAQVSMNLTDFERTPLHVVFEAVRREAEEQGTEIEGSEIVGLVPKKALEMCAAHFLKIENFDPGLVLENRLAKVMPEAGASPPPADGRQPASGLHAFLDALAFPAATPGGGSAAGAAAAMAAALGAMVAGLAAKKTPDSRELDQLAGQFQSARTFFEEAVWRDAASYDAVLAAYRIPKERRAGELEAALQTAACVPLEVAEALGPVRESLRRLREVAPVSMHSDIDAAEALALAAWQGARANVAINLASIADASFRTQAERRLEAAAPKEKNVPRLAGTGKS